MEADANECRKEPDKNTDPDRADNNHQKVQGDMAHSAPTKGLAHIRLKRRTQRNRNSVVQNTLTKNKAVQHGNDIELLH